MSKTFLITIEDTLEKDASTESYVTAFVDALYDLSIGVIEIREVMPPEKLKPIVSL